MDSEFIASLIQDDTTSHIGNREREHLQNNTLVEEQGRSYNGESNGTRTEGAQGAKNTAEDTSKNTHLGEAVDVVDFGAAQMGAAIVPQLEKLAKRMPSHCYDKIRVTDFTPPEFSDAEPPAPGYMRGITYLKDDFKVTALTINSKFTFPSASTLSQGYSPPSLEEIRSFFQCVFSDPPNKPLPYYVGPIPMPPDYIPLVDAGPRLLQRNNGKIPGVNTPFWYISQCDKTPATLHIEDGSLGSVNLLLAGAPKVWLFIPEREKSNFERCIGELYGPRRFSCSQEIRHHNAIVSPALLEKWRITYYLDYCLPGEMIVTRPNTYHQVLNMGPNVAESINIEFSDTPDMPVGYIWCKRGSGPAACGRHVITAPDFSLNPRTEISNTTRKRTKPPVASISKKAKVKPLSNPLEESTYGRFSQTEIHKKLTTELAQSDEATIRLLTCLFFAVASPEAVAQLRQTYLLRWTSNSHLFPSGETICEVMAALDKTDDILISCSFIRRYHLVRLVEHRNTLVHHHTLKRAEAGTRTRNDSADKTQRVESLALKDLYQEAYNNNDPSNALQTKLKNRLRLGGNWALLAKKFSIGILALLPTSKDTNLTNRQYVLFQHNSLSADVSRVEMISERDFNAFLDILDLERGEFLRQMSTSVDNIYHDILSNREPGEHYHFEGADQDMIMRTSFDHESLLEYCAKTNTSGF
jgi:hypothetical protein